MGRKEGPALGPTSPILNLNGIPTLFRDVTCSPEIMPLVS